MILFVCTGNTCRSPMAEALARARGMDARSCGVRAHGGEPASDGAMREMERRGLSLAHHRAQRASRTLAESAEHIYTMTEGIRQELLWLYPQLEAKIAVLSPEIPDPYGGSAEAYARAARAIDQALDHL